MDGIPRANAVRAWRGSFDSFGVGSDSELVGRSCRKKLSKASWGSVSTLRRRWLYSLSASIVDSVCYFTLVGVRFVVLASANCSPNCLVV